MEEIEEIEKKVQQWEPKTEYGKSLNKNARAIFSENSNRLRMFLAYQEAAEAIMPDHYDIIIGHNNTLPGFSSRVPSANLPLLVLKFPELKMTDSTANHTIYDMFIFLTNSSFYGKRTSFTVQELQQGYGHSHMSGGCNLNSYGNNFCLGNGPINTTLDSLRDDSFDVELIKYFIIEVKAYLSWQSNSGGPYKYFRSIPKHISYSNSLTNYASKNLNTFLTIDDIDFSDPFNIKLKEDIDVPEEGVQNPKDIIGAFKRNYRSINFRGKEISLKIVNEDELQISSDKNSRKLANNEKQSIERSISDAYKKTIEDSYIQKEIPINTFF